MLIIPNDSVNVRLEWLGNKTLGIIPTSTHYTVLYESYNTNNSTANGQLEVFCGDDDLLHVHNTANITNLERWKYTHCDNVGTFVRSYGMISTASTTVNMIYVPRDPRDTYEIVQNYDSSTNTIYLASTTSFVNTISNNQTYLVIILLIISTISILDFVRRYVMVNKR